MTLERDETIDLATARAVRLAGRDFHVAPLSLRQILAIADYVPKLSAVFLDLPITIAELVAAPPVVIEQAGGRKVDASERKPLPGELEPHRARVMIVVLGGSPSGRVLSANGDTAATDSNALVPSAPSHIYVGAESGGSNYGFDHFAQLGLWNVAPSAAQAAAMNGTA